MISFIGKMHAGLVFDRRVRVLAEAISAIIPASAKVLDVGCGDGTITSLIQANRPDIVIEGIDVMVRASAKIRVTAFDGNTLPFTDQSWDAVLFVDVLHHMLDAGPLVRDAARVARKAVIIKDHFADNPIDRGILSIMDWVGNAPHGVVLPYNYLSRQQWAALFKASGLDVTRTLDKVPLYPWPLNAVFGRDLHFVSVLATGIQDKQQRSERLMSAPTRRAC